MTKAVFQTNFKTHKIKISEAYHPHWQEDDQKLCPWQRNELEWHLHSQKPLELNITARASPNKLCIAKHSKQYRRSSTVAEYADTKQPHTEIRLIMGAFTWQNNGSCSLILGMSVVSMSITTYTCILDTELKGNRNENTICMEPWTRNIYVRGSAMPRASTSIDTEMVSLWSSICQNAHKEICIRTEWIWSCCKHDTASSRLSAPSNSQSREQP